ncbi:MAG: HdeD family acid-resistance protein [Gemmatimonadales bacterium]|jgi:uncharacterized membrane protein HdeD (DUF308 family)
MTDHRRAKRWLEQAKEHAGLVIALGTVELLIGIVAIGSPLVTGVAIAFMIGSILVLAGIARVVSAFSAGSFGAGFLAFLGGLLALAAGLVMLFRPGAGLTFLAWMLAIYFVVDGVARLALGLRTRGEPGSGWEIFGGVVSVLLGVLIYANWPLSGAWAIGTLVGVHLIISGWTIVGIGLAARRAVSEVKEALGA